MLALTSGNRFFDTLITCFKTLVREQNLWPCHWYCFLFFVVFFLIRRDNAVSILSLLSSLLLLLPLSSSVLSNEVRVVEGVEGDKENRER